MNPELLKKESLRLLRSSEHLLTVTYKLIDEPKILISVLNNLLASWDMIIKYYVWKKGLLNTSNPLNFFTEFKKATGKKFSKYIILFNQMKELLNEHNNSMVEFTKNDSLVICDDDYKIKLIDYKKINEFLLKTKEFFNKLLNDLSS